MSPSCVGDGLTIVGVGVGVALVGVGVGVALRVTLTQYELPALIPLQSSLIEGFCGSLVPGEYVKNVCLPMPQSLHGPCPTSLRSTGSHMNCPVHRRNTCNLCPCLARLVCFDA